jgi:hypothetical protein
MRSGLGFAISATMALMAGCGHVIAEVPATSQVRHQATEAKSATPAPAAQPAAPAEAVSGPAETLSVPGEKLSAPEAAQVAKPDTRTAARREASADVQVSPSIAPQDQALDRPLSSNGT